MILFVALSVVHIALVGLDAGLAASITKALLMPALALWVVRQGGPRLLVAALFFSWVGDVALEIDGLFILGMAGFGAAHVCFVTWFVRHGALEGLRRRWWAVVAGFVAWAGTIAVLWGPLGEEAPELQVPILAYSLLLTATAITAFGVSIMAGIGGALFLLSDTLIAMDIADVARPEPGDVWVMVTYLVAELLLALGIVRRNRSEAIHDTAPFSAVEKAR
ncbi:lysoplasmalogenase [Mumia zhuanghuii]|uniref:Lysoplasmalogenase n=2 Tax=Mumia TaxID=1546255 RepID=A0ABW1QGW7_9ACTN|nr:MULTISPECIES: lysoplasmalogenase [Mumia]KAA1425356.1 lysoplasmalogenase [Mumia zhuanghuii]